MISMRQGYTIIETITVIVLLLIVMGAGVRSFTRVTQQNRLTRDASAFVDVLAMAKEKTIARDLQTNVSCGTFGGYRVRVLSMTTFRLEMNCTTPVNYPAQTLSNTVFVGTPTVQFTYPYATVPGAAASEQQVVVRNPAISQCIDIFINRTGVIRTGAQRTC